MRQVCSIFDCPHEKQWVRQVLSFLVRCGTSDPLALVVFVTV